MQKCFQTASHIVVTKSTVKVRLFRALGLFGIVFCARFVYIGRPVVVGVADIPGRRAAVRVGGRQRHAKGVPRGEPQDPHTNRGQQQIRQKMLAIHKYQSATEAGFRSLQRTGENWSSAKINRMRHQPFNWSQRFITSLLRLQDRASQPCFHCRCAARVQSGQHGDLAVASPAGGVPHRP